MQNNTKKKGEESVIIKRMVNNNVESDILPIY